MTKPSQIEQFNVQAVNKDGAKKLFAAAKKIYPKRVDGKFRQLKWLIMTVTLAIYYITPWLRWDRGEFAPDQAVLVDLANRRFYFFFIEIWPQEFFYVAGLLIMAGIGLFLVTSVWGRAWCGYTCPQTVWVDLFLVIERAIEGDRNARMKLDKASWDFKKLRMKVMKHIIWLLVAISTGGAWIFYFADAPSLFVSFFTLEAPFVAYSTVAVLTATTYIFGGFMRDQVCTYMCPWPRIQAAMLDEESLVVTYNDYRGEPRTAHRKKNANDDGSQAPMGDCIDCNKCVVVCPMGIDIRDGQQMECITCALCIDACDSVMEKVGKPKGLISYATLKEYDKAAAGEPVQNSVPILFRPRTLIYSGIWCLVGLSMLFVLATRSRLDVNVLHDRNPLMVQLSDGSIRNGYTVKILNMEPKKHTGCISFKGLPKGQMRIEQEGAELIKNGEKYKLLLEPDVLRELKIYVTMPQGFLPQSDQTFQFVAEIPASEEYHETSTKFHVKKN
jgi:cytochrome c oxidase accessory protein FixG